MTGRIAHFALAFGLQISIIRVFQNFAPSFVLISIGIVSIYALWWLANKWEYKWQRKVGERFPFLNWYLPADKWSVLVVPIGALLGGIVWGIFYF